MASISNIKRFSNEAKDAASDPASAIPKLRDAIWQLCDIVSRQKSEIKRLTELINSKKL